MRNLFTHPSRLPLIAPSILSADFAKMGDECRSVLSPPASLAGQDRLGAADLLHLDVMDGHFVPNLTMGPDMCRALRRALRGVFLDVHLMVTDPWPHAAAFAEAGADHITFHIEAAEAGESAGGPGVRKIAASIRDRGLTVGLALNPPTSIDRIYPYLDAVDLVLVMSVNPGFSGQTFIADSLEKARLVSDRLLPTQRLQMDGGIKQSNIAEVLDAGVDVVVAASAVFGAETTDRPAVIRTLRQKLVY